MIDFTTISQDPADWAEPFKAVPVDSDWVRANVNPAEAVRIYQDPQFWPVNNRLEPWSFEMPPVGTWRCDPFGEMEVLVPIPVPATRASEGEWDLAMLLPSTQAYIEWARAGQLPPPIRVLRHSNTGELLSGNRRRWLAAREAGLETMMCWFSETRPGDTRNAWWVPEWGEFYQKKVQFVVEKGLNPADYLDREVIKRFGL